MNCSSLKQSESCSPLQLLHKLLACFRAYMPKPSGVAALTRCIGAKICHAMGVLGQSPSSSSTAIFETNQATHQADLSRFEAKQKAPSTVQSCSWHSHGAAFSKVAPTDLLMCVLASLRSRLLKIPLYGLATTKLITTHSGLDIKSV